MRRIFVLVLGAQAACAGEEPSGPDYVGASEDVQSPAGSRPRSDWVHFQNGSLKYRHEGRGDRVPDFSNAGYGGGGVRIPRVTGPIVQVRPGGGDDLLRIQRAIDQVAALPKDRRGIRGVVLLKAGTYQVPSGKEGHGRRDKSHIVIDADGIILRGEGSGKNGTTIRAMSRANVSERDQTVVIEIGHKDGRPEKIRSSEQNIRDDYVPVGGRSFEVGDVSAFSVGDQVIVERHITRDWIEKIGMDSCAHKGGSHDDADVPNQSCLRFGEDWEDWSGGAFKFDRVVVRIDAAGRRIVVDAPITQAIDREFGGGSIYKYRFRERVSQVGIENLGGDSRFDNTRPDDHAWNFIVTRAVENAWIRQVRVENLARSLVTVNEFSKWITVEDSAFVSPISTVQGKRRYPFAIQGGQLILIQRCRAEEGRHSFVAGSTTLGPNVFLFCDAKDSRTSSETHGYWNTGLLYDNVSEDRHSSTPLSISGITIRNEGGTDSHGHGWSGANSVLWNSRAPRIHVEDPPTARNWAIGCTTPNASGDGEWEHRNNPVDPRSLYLAQLRERLGSDAVRNIEAD